MPKLILEKFQCVEETDEVGSDNPYFFTFVGQRSSVTNTARFLAQRSGHR
jgi:hypothetical protein